MTEYREGLNARFGEVLGGVIDGELTTDVLLNAYPDVVPHVPTGFEKLSEHDQKLIAGMSVFMQLMGKPPVPKGHGA